MQLLQEDPSKDCVVVGAAAVDNRVVVAFQVVAGADSSYQVVEPYQVVAVGLVVAFVTVPS